MEYRNFDVFASETLLEKRFVEILYFSPTPSNPT